MHKKGCQNDKKIRIFVIPPLVSFLGLGLVKGIDHNCMSKGQEYENT